MGNEFNLSWTKAEDESEFTYNLVIKDGKNVVYATEISGDATSYSVNLLDMGIITGKSLSFELYASQYISEKGQPVLLQSSTLKASAKVVDVIAPEVTFDGVYADGDAVERLGLGWDDYLFAGDPIKNGKGTLSLYDIDWAFTDNVGIKSYVLDVDNKSFTTDSSKMADYGEYTQLDFKITGLSSGDQMGMLYAVDAAGNRSAGITVYFDVD